MHTESPAQRPLKVKQTHITQTYTPTEGEIEREREDSRNMASDYQGNLQQQN